MKRFYQSGGLVYILCFSLLVVVSSNLAAKGYHITINGTSSGSGTLSSPWSIEHAFDRNNPVQPVAGDTVFIHEGVYVVKFSIWFKGNASANVVIKNWPGDKVVIDGNNGANVSRVILVNNDYITIEGLEIMHSGLSRTTESTSLFPDYPYGVHGIFINSIATNFEIRNCIIHDTHANAVAAYGPNTKIIGNIFYYNGWDNPARGSAYGFYMQNTDTTTFGIATHNIIFSNFSKALHVYGESTPVLTNITVNDNICFNPGAPSWEANDESGTEGSIFVGGLCPVANIEIAGNHCYNTSNSRGNPIRVGYWDQDNHNIVLKNNYAIGGLRSLQVLYSRDVEAKGNFFYNRNRVLTRLTGEGQDYVDYNSYDWDDNTYYFSGTYEHLAFDGGSWDEWKANGLDRSGAYYQTAPTTNEYHIKYISGMKWANLVIYDWEKTGTVPVDISSVVELNSNFSIYDVQNLEGEPVVTGVYLGNDVQVPTNLRTVTPIIGDDVASPIVHTDQEFNVYIIVPELLPLSCELDIVEISTSGNHQLVNVKYETVGNCTEPVKLTMININGDEIYIDEGYISGDNIDISTECPGCDSGEYTVQLSSDGFEVTDRFEYMKSDLLHIKSFHPNPTVDLVGVTFQAGSDTDLNFRIVDDLGNIVDSETVNSSSIPKNKQGDYKFAVNLEPYEKGMYTIIIESQTSRDSCKVILTEFNKN